MLSNMEDIKKFFDYMFFRDMGEIGEGCMMSFFIWACIIFWFVMIGMHYSWFRLCGQILNNVNAAKINWVFLAYMETNHYLCSKNVNYEEEKQKR